jgi:hypothetical protein
VQASTIHEREIVRLVDELPVNALYQAAITHVAASLSFSMSPDEVRFLLSYITQRRQSLPIS